MHGDIHFHAPGAGSPPTPRQLPADVRGFVNRLRELEEMDRALSADGGESVAVSVVAGTAGVGKTSLVLHWAHRIRDRFPDGQFYVNLRGYDPGFPVTAEQALDGFLRALGVPPGLIPADLEQRSALYRSLLSARRMLVVLDNAATVGQVRPLLPGTVGCLVVVTSRSRMSGLVARDGALRLTLDMLAEPDAIALVRTVTSGYRGEEDPEELAELVRLCARLPLALRIAAERAASRPRMQLGELISDLRDESGLWGALTADANDEADAVRTVFAWSYRALTEETGRLFRRLGLHPGPEFGVQAAAAVAGTTVGQVRILLDDLVGAYLIEDTPHGRYQLHDLLRAYATDQAVHEESAEDLDRIRVRALSWYLHSAAAAQSLISPQPRSVPLDPVEDGVSPMVFADYAAALSWYETEKANLVAATRTAAATGHHRTAWQFAAVLRDLYMDLNPFDDWLATARIGIASARAVGDRFGEAEALESMAMVLTQSNKADAGIEHYLAAVAARQEVGDRLGEAETVNRLGLAYLRRRRLRDAQACFDLSARSHEDLGDSWRANLVRGNLALVHAELLELSEASALLEQVLAFYRRQEDLGRISSVLRTQSIVQRELGQYASALESVEEAVAIERDRESSAREAFWLLDLGKILLADGRPTEALPPFHRAATIQRQLGDRSREAMAWDGTGEAYRMLGQLDEAIDFHRRAAAAQRELDDHWLLALSLDNLAAAQAGAGLREEAEQHWQEALRLLTAYGDPAADRVRIRIGSAILRNRDDQLDTRANDEE
ncbi:MAG: tetratricopeptide repeat protein [Streptomyces sp.]|nr:tetratricopeptide repeat protein [Streptomyces sp.]